MDFKEYLEERKLARRSIESYTKYTESFIGWHGMEAERIDYQALTGYIGYLRKSGHGASYISGQLCAVRHWLEWQKAEGNIGANPANDMKVMDIGRRLPHDLLDGLQLRNIYMEYEPNTPERARNRQLLGFLALQGLRTAEACRLEKSDIDLAKGVARILASTKAEGRLLELPTFQLRELAGWMEGRREGPLFATKSGGNPQWAIAPLMGELRKLGIIKSTNQLRASAIAYWAKSYGIRQAQYMAGHRYASSTERYAQADPEKLRKAVLGRHPLDM